MPINFSFLAVSFVIFLLFILNGINTQGICGEIGNTPRNVTDCINYSNKTDFCCYLNATDAAALYSVCIAMKSDNVFSKITVGNMEYSVDCRGLPDYWTYFPFEGLYEACGPQNPGRMNDCWKYNTADTPCCLASKDPSFGAITDPFCYFYPKNSLFEVKNYTEKNLNNTDLYFACGSLFLNTGTLIFLFYLLLFLII